MENKEMTLITVTEYAKLKGKSIHTIYQRIYLNKLKAIRQYGRYLIPVTIQELTEGLNVKEQV